MLGALVEADVLDAPALGHLFASRGFDAVMHFCAWALDYMDAHPCAHAFNLSNGPDSSVRQVIAAAAEVTGCDIPTRWRRAVPAIRPCWCLLPSARCWPGNRPGPTCLPPSIALGPGNTTKLSEGAPWSPHTQRKACCI